MKRIYFCLIALALSVSTLSAQERVTEKKILGNWKLIIDIEEEMEEAKLEAENEDSFFAEVTMKWISGLVSGLIDEIEIYMEFKPDGKVRVVVTAFDEREIEYSNWYIKDGKLFIEDSDNFSMNENDYWMFKNDILMNYDSKDKRGGRNENIYLVRVD